MTDNLDIDSIIDQHRSRSGTNHRCRVCKEWAPCTTSLLAVQLRDALAEIEAARKDARVYQELYEQRVDTLVQVEAERDALAVRLAAAERKVRAVELLHVWTNDDGKRFVFADELAVALEIPGAEAVTDHG